MYMRALFLLIALLVGCAPRQQIVQQPYQTQADRQGKEISEKLKIARESQKSCFDSNAQTPAYKTVSEFLILSQSQANKLDLMASKSRLTEKQKTALREFSVANSRCRQIMISGLSGVPTQTAYSKAYRLKDSIYAKLLAGQINIGQANEEVSKVDQNFRDELKTIGDKWNADMKAQHEAELQNVQQQRQRQIENQQRQQQLDAERRRADAEALRQYTSPPVVNLTPGMTQGNTNYELNGTFKGQPQNTYSNPAVNCNPNGFGGYRCQ